MTPRAHISTKKRLAAALLARREISYDHAKQMTEDQFNSLYQWHHNKRYAEGGGDHFSNLEPMLIAAHRDRTAKIDVPLIAKNKRIVAKHAAFRRRLLGKDAGEAVMEAGRKRKMQSRRFQRRRT